MNTPRLLLSSAVLLTASTLALAQSSGTSGNNARLSGNQTSGPQRGPGGRGGPNGLLALFDTNHDGVLSADEIAAAPAVLKALDRNGDGQITPDEVPPPPGRGPQGQRGAGNGQNAANPPQGGSRGQGGAGQGPGPLGPLSLFDTDHDGVLSAAEIAAAASVLKGLEQNGANQITPGDLPPPPNGGPGGPPPRGGRGNRGPGGPGGPGGQGGSGGSGSDTPPDNN